MNVYTLLHIIFIFTWTLYIFFRFFIPQNILYLSDIAYIYCSLLVFFHWLVFNDECIISYMAKLHENPNYIIGSSYETTDLIDVFGKYTPIVVFFMIAFVLTTNTVIMSNFKIQIVVQVVYVLAVSFYMIILRLGLHSTPFYVFWKFCLMIYLVFITSYFSIKLSPYLVYKKKKLNM